MKKLLASIFILMVIAIGNNLRAQTANAKDSVVTPKNTAKELDTQESIKHMGSELLFQLKKRLHLTSEEEEKEKSKKKQKVALTFLGIKIERE